MSSGTLEDVKARLVCPTHRTRLEYRDSAASGSADGELVCAAGCHWPIHNGIPRFVGEKSYASSFGVQWNRYTRTELDSFTGASYSRQRLERCLGAPVESLRGKKVLECGSGAGRFTELLVRNAGALACIDLSIAVDANKRNCSQFGEYLIVQGDIHSSPLPKQYFDVVVCLGVIQHTSNPEKTIASLAQHVKPGGQLVIDHYTRERGTTIGALISTLDYVDMVYPIRAVLKRMNPERAIRATELLTAFCDPIRKQTCKITLVDKFARRVFPTACYYRKFPDLDHKIVYEMNQLDTCDWLTDYYKFFRSRKQIRQCLENLGLEVSRCDLGGNGVEARAMVPATNVAMSSRERVQQYAV